MKRLFALLAGVSLALSLTACGSDITSGTVVKKSFTPAHTDTWQQPITMQQCSGTGTSRICYPITIGYTTETNHVNDNWQFELRSCDSSGKCKHGWVDVPHGDYDSVVIGQDYTADH